MQKNFISEKNIFSLRLEFQLLFIVFQQCWQMWMHSCMIVSLLDVMFILCACEHGFSEILFECNCDWKPMAVFIGIFVLKCVIIVCSMLHCQCCLCHSFKMLLNNRSPFNLLSKFSILTNQSQVEYYSILRRSINLIIFI